MGRRTNIIMMFSVWVAIAVSLVFAIERHKTSQRWLDVIARKGPSMSVVLRTLSASGTYTEDDGSSVSITVQVIQSSEEETFAELRRNLEEAKQAAEEEIGSPISWGAAISAVGGGSLQPVGPVGDFVRRRISVGGDG
jgi:hypothetical protein